MTRSIETPHLKTIGEMVEGFIEDPQWEAFIADDSMIYVDITGTMMYQNEQVDVVIQIKFHEDTIEMYALEFNSVPQSTLIFNALIKAMYDEDPDISASLITQPSRTFLIAA